MTSLELREKRNEKWEAAKAFLDTRRNEDGLLSAEDDATYEKMEKEIQALGKEIERTERKEAMDRELAMPINKPILSTPDNAKMDEKTGIASDEYKDSFWNMVRSKSPSTEVLNALSEGVDSEGGYLVPDEFEHTLIEKLEEENIFRGLANIIQTTSGDRKIPMVAEKGSAAWLDEGESYDEDDDTFTQISIGAHKVGTMIKISDELLQDSAFNMENYISKEFVRRIGRKEEDAFFNGDGDCKPMGILDDTYGAEVGVTAASATEITGDEIIDLFYSLKAPYRKNAVWIMNDSTIAKVRKLKTGDGQYIWQPSLVAGQPDTIMGKPVLTSASMPGVGDANKSIVFGDLSYYWIADRQGIFFKRLDELYAQYGQIGFRASKRLDGRLVLTEAIKVLQHPGKKLKK